MFEKEAEEFERRNIIAMKIMTIVVILQTE